MLRRTRTQTRGDRSWSPTLASARRRGHPREHAAGCDGRGEASPRTASGQDERERRRLGPRRRGGPISYVITETSRRRALEDRPSTSARRGSRRRRGVPSHAPRVDASLGPTDPKRHHRTSSAGPRRDSGGNGSPRRVLRDRARRPASVDRREARGRPTRRAPRTMDDANGRATSYPEPAGVLGESRGRYRAKAYKEDERPATSDPPSNSTEATAGYSSSPGTRRKRRSTCIDDERNRREAGGPAQRRIGRVHLAADAKSATCDASTAADATRANRRERVTGATETGITTRAVADGRPPRRPRRTRCAGGGVSPRDDDGGRRRR